jgi:BirA family biotin operon repressor/biotin-[acetyl-CoA-carboxylase] ligase
VSTRDQVLVALRSAGTAGISGQEVARQLGVSRVAVSKHVAALRQAGYQIAASPGSGYRLIDAPPIALPSEVRPLLRHPLWVRVEGGRLTGSTNDDAKALAREGAEEGTVVVAAEQTEGRGRLGRHWVSSPGGAYVSVILRPRVAPVEAAPLALVIAIGIARGMRELNAIPQLKWPNDVWLDGRKLAGVLLETATEGDSVPWAVAGFGLNVIRPQESFEAAAYLEESVGPVAPARAAAAALDGIASAYIDWRTQGFAGLAQEFESSSVLAGRVVSVSDSVGRTVVEGPVRGIDPEGRLLVADGESIVRVAAGDVTLRRSAV